jgi:flagellar hook-basal body complex protein FliE
MSISAISGVIASAASTASSVGASAGAGSTGAAGGANFATALQNGLQGVQDSQNKADQLGIQAATGDLKDVHSYMIAATQSELTTELTVTLRNKALDAFNEIMRMQA